jgi:hypothetical protein
MVGDLIAWVINWAKGLIEASRTNYGVDPIIFVVISTIASPAFYYSIYRVIRAAVKRNGRELMLWGPIFGCAFIAPYVYVLFFGRNLPWWVYVVIGLLVAQGIYSLVRKIRGRKAAEAGKPPEPGERTGTAKPAGTGSGTGEPRKPGRPKA